MFVEITKVFFYTDLPQTTINKAINETTTYANDWSCALFARFGHFEHITWTR